MNPLLQQALGLILRWLLTIAATWLVSHGIWSAPDADWYVAAAVLALLSLGWGLWQKYKSHLTVLTALNLPGGSTLADLKDAQAGVEFVNSYKGRGVSL